MASLFKIWWLQVGAIVWMTLLVLTLIVLLVFYDGKPIFTWHGVTLNAVVSVLATACNASLLFSMADLISQWKWVLFTDQSRPLIDFELIEAASRGPLGSVLAMWKRRELSFFYVGTSAIVLSLAVEPFTQQLVQHKQILVPVPDVATVVPRASRYAKGNEYHLQLSSVGLEPGERGLDNTFADADFSMQSAISYGLTQPLTSVIQQGIFTCATGNCTWPSYESLAVCSTCKDVTEKLETHQSLSALSATLAKDNPGAVASDGTAFRLPNELFVDNADGWAFDDPNGVLMTILGTGNVSQTVSMAELDTLIWSMSMIRVSPDQNDTSTVWPDLPITATECALSYCVNSYNHEVRNGVVYQQVEPVKEAFRSPESWQPTNSFFGIDLSPEQISSVEFDSYYSLINRTDLSMTSPVSGYTYNISQVAVDSISSYFKGHFAGPTQNFSVSNEDEKVKGLLNGFYIVTISEQYSPSVTQSLYASKDLSSTFEALAMSMSNALRSGADDVFEGRGKQVTGSKEVRSIVYDIQWPWISLHLLLVFMAWFFVVVTIQQNHRNGQEGYAWKSSTLAVMSQGWKLQGLLEGLTTTKEMEQVARSTNMSLLERHETYGHVGVEQLDIDPLQDLDNKNNSNSDDNSNSNSNYNYNYNISNKNNMGGHGGLVQG